MMEYWVIIGIALGASGMFYALALIVVLYFLLQRRWPDAGFELLTVTSTLTGMSFADLFKIVLRPELFSLDHIWEPFGVFCITIALLYTRKRGWAWLLMVYSGGMGALLLLAAAWHLPKNVRPQFQVIVAAIYFMVLWLLVRWIRQQLPPVSTHAKTLDSGKPAPPSENSSAKS
ncbi:MAG: hypothetical protein ACLQAH_09280 [Limisphaerales bacterium]